MKIVSQNLTNYSFPIPNDSIYRINLAWVNDLKELSQILDKHKIHQIFIDLPINRTKPPNNCYSIEDLIPILKENKNIKYFAISNVNSKNDIEKYIQLLPKEIAVVPKIESKEGVDNIQEITNFLPYEEKVIMLDHDDLYSSLARAGASPLVFKEYFNKLVKYCNENKITLLRTIGVIFSDDEKRVTQYVR